MKLSLFAQLEQFLRIVCLLCFLFAAITTIMAQQLFAPIFPVFDKLTGHFFTRERKFAPLHVYIHKYFELGMFKMLGIEYIVENRVILCQNFRNFIVFLEQSAH